MNKEFVPYEIALALKELGFNRECFSWYREGILENKVNEIFYFTHSLRGDAFVSAPLYQQAFKWFREKYKLISYINEYNKDGGLWIKIKESRNIEVLYSELTSFDINEYEEAELACLRKLIELLKTKQR